MSLLYEAPTGIPEGYTPVVRPSNSPLKWLEFGRLRLGSLLSEYNDETGGQEMVICLFGGKADVEVECNGYRATFEGIGNRTDVFSGLPTMLYLPRGCRFTITRRTDQLDAGVFKAPSESDGKPVLVRDHDVVVKKPGIDTWRREVCTAVGPDVPASRLIVGETWSLPGLWSSYPPHKHDACNPPNEGKYEEVFFFTVNPPNGFGIQRVYTEPGDPDPLDEVYVVKSGDTVVIPRGYHPVASAGGCRVHYFWALAGEGRTYAAWSTDPRFQWLLDMEAGSR